MIVVIGGPPGGGKTTVAERLAQAHGLALVSAGKLFREMAQARGMDLEAFGRLAEADYSIDRELDRRILEAILRFDASGRDVVVDGRIQAHLLTLRRVPCTRVLIDAPIGVRAARIAGREGKPVNQAEAEIVQREKSEALRYKAIYAIDIRDRGIYDLIIDSSNRTPDDIAALVWSKVEG